MIELIQTWLVGVTCAAMLVAVADSLTPAGTVRKIGRLIGGLVLLSAVVKPLLTLDYGVLAMASEPYRAAISAVSDDLDQTNQQLMKTIIGEKTGAYILDKAEALGAPCTSVAVTCETGEGGVPFPAAVTVDGPLDANQRAALSRSIEAELAIPAQRQTFENGEVRK